MIQKCPNCKPHSFQDTRYGEKVRVMNPLKKVLEQQQEVRCTICGAVAKSTGTEDAQ